MIVTFKHAAFLAAIASLLQGAAVAQTAATHELIAGTVVQAKLDQALSSKTNHNGDTFTLIPTTGNFFFKNPDMGGCVFAGHLENVTPAGPTHKATMSAVLDGLRCPGSPDVQPAQLKLLSVSTFDPKTHMMRDTMIVAGSAVAGKMVSGTTGVKGGTIGGAAAGVALVSTMKSDITVKKDVVLKVRLQQAVAVPVSASH